MEVNNWWVGLSAVAVVNIVLLIISILVFYKRKHVIDVGIIKRRQLVLWLSAIYALVCAYRSFMPRIDLEKICLVESYWSSVFWGRSFTTLAELAFILQCALMLNEASNYMHNRTTRLFSYMLVPLIVIAEISSWYAMLSTNYLASVIEESLWAVCGALLLISFIMLRKAIRKGSRKFVDILTVFASGYVLFMLTVDIPMYWTRWVEDTQNNKHYLLLLDGLVESIRVCKQSFDYEIWREEMPWMSLYFSITVWLSMVLAHTPDYRLYRRTKYINKDI